MLTIHLWRRSLDDGEESNVLCVQVCQNIALEGLKSPRHAGAYTHTPNIENEKPRADPLMPLNSI